MVLVNVVDVVIDIVVHMATVDYVVEKVVDGVVVVDYSDGKCGGRSQCLLYSHWWPNFTILMRVSARTVPLVTRIGYILEKYNQCA